MVKDLFELSADNRAFLAARLLSGGVGMAGDSVPRPYRERIHDVFYRKGGLPRTHLGLADARRAIRDFRKATADAAGTLELMMTYVETGTDYRLDFGAEDAPLFNSLASVLDEIGSACDSNDGLALYGRFRKRLLSLAERARGIGWGYGDHVRAIVEGLEERWTNAGAPPRAES